MPVNPLVLSGLPAWVPDAVRLYLHHTDHGLSLRALARREGRHASTVMRQVRRYEHRRDDPLIDEALSALSRGTGPHTDTVTDLTCTKEMPMSAPIRPQTLEIDEATLLREGRRILRRMAEPGAVLAIAPDMEKAVVLREFPDGRTARTGVMDRVVAQAFALKDWIICRKAGRIASYELTATGRLALKRMFDSEAQAGLAEAATPFADQHRDWADRDVSTEDGPRKLRYNLAESPVSVLGRRRDKDGKPFLDPDLVQAAERLREDFEAAQMGPRITQNWDRFLTAGDRGGYRPDAGGGEFCSARPGGAGFARSGAGAWRRGAAGLLFSGRDRGGRTSHGLGGPVRQDRAAYRADAASASL